jgi:hypothetical protein
MRKKPMKTKLLVAAAILGLTTSAIAYPPKPDKCPSAAAINDERNTAEVAVQDFNKQWAVTMTRSTYDTVNGWSLIVGRIDADNEEDAISKALAVLATLGDPKGPTPVQRLNKWGCVYSNPQNYVVTTINPSFQGAATEIINAA